MATHSGSIRRKLQVGFALLAALLAGSLAAFMNHALQRSLDVEAVQAIVGQAEALARALDAGQSPIDLEPQPRPEKVSWRVLDRTGRVLSQSKDLASLPGEAPEVTDGKVHEVHLEGGETYSLLVRPWNRGTEKGALVLMLDRTHEAGLIRGFQQTLLLGVIVAAILATFLARLVARWGLAPLGALIDEAGTINVRNLDRRLEARHFPLELQELVATLNGALARLQNAFERMSRLGGELAHELRTPLQNLRSVLENRARQRANPLDPAELGALIEDCDRMAALIEQIMFLAQSESPALLKRVSIPAKPLLEEVRGFFEAAAEAAEVTLSVQGEDALKAYGDRLLLMRALHNLVANALRHTPAGGQVVLGVEAVPEGLQLFVEDTGAGIPEAWIAKLGTPFVRPPGARNAEGHGLGLAIVKRIAVMLGGDMVVASQEGQGTRVALRLPVPGKDIGSLPG